MADPHAKAIKAARKTVDDLARLFGRLGTSEHPRGALLSAYRQARRAMRGNLDNPQMVEAILFDLRIAVEHALRSIYGDAVGVGVNQAARELAAYELPEMGATLAQEEEQALAATLAILDAQIGSARVLAISTRDEALLLGDEVRAGLLTPEPVIKDGARWAALLAVEGHRQSTNGSIRQMGAEEEYMRQAIAAIDERTTDCCLRVHGQVVGLNGRFRLTGTPRYADEIDAPPFHWYCRTAVALVPRATQDDTLTRGMRDAARAELQARAVVQGRIDDLKARLVRMKAAPDIRIRKADTQAVKDLRRQLRREKRQLRVEIHPAHARSGR